MSRLVNPDPRRYREARVGWEALFQDVWPDGIPCFLERSDRGRFIVPLFPREVCEQVTAFYTDRAGELQMESSYQWAGDRLLILYPSDEIDAEENGERDCSTIEEVDPVGGLYHLDQGLLWDERPFIDQEVEALRHQDAAVARGQALAARKQLVRRQARSLATA